MSSFADGLLGFTAGFAKGKSDQGYRDEDREYEEALLLRRQEAQIVKEQRMMKIRAEFEKGEGYAKLEGAGYLDASGNVLAQNLPPELVARAAQSGRPITKDNLQKLLDNDLTIDAAEEGENRREAMRVSAQKVRDAEIVDQDAEKARIALDKQLKLEDRQKANQIEAEQRAGVEADRREANNITTAAGRVQLVSEVKEQIEAANGKGIQIERYSSRDGITANYNAVIKNVNDTINSSFGNLTDKKREELVEANFTDVVEDPEDVGRAYYAMLYESVNLKMKRGLDEKKRNQPGSFEHFNATDVLDRINESVTELDEELQVASKGLAAEYQKRLDADPSIVSDADKAKLAKEILNSGITMEGPIDPATGEPTQHRVNVSDKLKKEHTWHNSMEHLFINSMITTERSPNEETGFWDFWN